MMFDRESQLVNYWKPHEVDRLRQLYNTGQPLRAIAIALGRSFRSVAWQIYNLGLERSSWTAEQVETLIARHAAGESFSTIASAIDATRNACIGKAWRLGLAQHKKSGPPKPHPPKPRPERKTRFQGMPKPPTVPVQPLIRAVPADVPPPRNLAITDLAMGDCRWPVTDGLPYLFCGNPAEPDCSYCAPHYRIGHNRMADRHLNRGTHYAMK